MLDLTPETCLSLWRRAVESEFGLRFGTTPEEAQSAQNRMYEARKGYPELSGLSLKIMQPGNEIWLFHKEARLDD